MSKSSEYKELNWMKLVDDLLAMLVINILIELEIIIIRVYWEKEKGNGRNKYFHMSVKDVKYIYAEE